MGYVRLTGVTYADPELAYDTFILFTGADSFTRLIDLNGTIIHEWTFPGVPPRILDPALTRGQKGTVGLQLSESGDVRGGIYANGSIGQLNWNGDRLWEWGKEAPSGAARQNHDWQLLPNENWLVLVTVPRVVEDLGPHVIGDQGLVEVNPDGKVVWEWSSGDHISDLGFSERGLELLRETVARDPGNPWGCLEMNSASALGPNQWYEKNPEVNSIFHPENIIVSFRKANVVGIIDKTTGRIVWRLGPYFDEKSGDQHQRILRHNVPRPLDQISGQHNPHFIPKGLPGAGNILVFDNQGGAGYPPAALGIYAGSRILEIDPTTKQIVWQYTAEDSGLPPWTFFSSFVSNAQRLPNGNTLITEGMNGRIFQVNAEGKVAWEFYSPHYGYGVAGEPEVTKPRVEGVDRLSLTPLVYRSQAVPDEWVPAGLRKSAVVPVDKS
ncbi:ASST-domain-containing protein [Talaromyces proteolyticus]|uniref:ASST-domain-containing protein n=1 Tax=Talaromyces proteolyticus TaxID=1131652 RepID=A0AAD4KMA4_9EURO|nr:ASST-domain-containing protein [Talaromyces proteolyticus]KAH8694236.1 ASST-domain-containing protein [Talaromyces proteolyticus]